MPDLLWNDDYEFFSFVPSGEWDEGAWVVKSANYYILLLVLGLPVAFARE